MSNQVSCFCENCGEEIPVKSKFCLECGAPRKKQRVGSEGVPEFPQARSDAHAVVEANEGGATPGAPSVTQGDQDKDGSLNVRKRRALEEGGGTVKVRRKGSGASEGTEQVCGELNDFYQQVSDVSESKLAVEGHSVVVDQQFASVPTASAQYEPVSKDGTTNSIETNAKAALAETGATKAALPQSVLGSDSSDLRNGAKNEASMSDQKGGTRAVRIESNLRSGMQDDKSANDSKSEIQSEGATHISKAEHIFNIEPQDQGASANGEDSGVTGAKNTAESSTALPTMPQSEEATVVPGSDVKTIQTSEPVPENGTYTMSSVPIHVVLDDPLPMEMTAIENEMLATNQAPSPEDNVARDGADPYDQNEDGTQIKPPFEISNDTYMLDEKNTQYLSTLPEEMDNVAMLDQQENMGASNLLQTGLISDIDRAGQAVEGAMKTTEEAQSDNQGLNSNIEGGDIERMKPRAEIGNESNAYAVASPNAASKDVDHTSQEPKYLNDQGHGHPDPSTHSTVRSTAGKSQIGVGPSADPQGSQQDAQMYRKSAETLELIPGGKGGKAAQVKHDTDGNQKARGKLDTSGFQTIQANSISVTFHVLLPYEIWGWNEKTKLVMFFGEQILGNWRAGIGNFIARDLGHGMCEMTTTINIKADLLKGARSIPYRYGVLNYMSGNITSQYEFLHGAPSRGRAVNRALIIPSASFQSGVHHQYDTAMYPAIKTKGYLGFFSGFFSGGSPTVPANESVRQKCLMTYLDKLQNNLMYCEFSANWTVDDMVAHAMHIVTSLTALRIAHDDKVAVWNDEKLPFFMLKSWIFPIVDIVKNSPVSTAEESGKKVMVAIIIICIVGKLLETKQICFNDIPVPYAASMLQMLCLRPDLENKKCLDYVFVRSVIPNHYVKDVTAAISKLGNSLIAVADIEHVEWFYCLPILHFLNNRTKPFDALDLHVPVESFEFLDPLLKLGAFCNKVAEKEGFFVRHFEKLKPLLHIDPMLQCAFTYVCPLRDRSHLIHNLSPYLCIGIMIKRLNDKKELSYWSSDLVLRHIQDITLTLQSPVFKLSPSHMMQAAISLLSVSTKMINGNPDDYLNAYKAIVLLIFSAIMQLSADTQQTSIDDAVTKMQLYFSEWISGTKSGRDMFGGDRLLTPKTAVAELKIWVSLFAAECPVEFTHHWHGVVKNIVESRVNKLNSENRINLLCAVESCENTPEVLLSIFTEAAIAGLDKINEQGWLNTVKNLEKMCSEASKKNVQRLGRVLTSFVKKRYPRAKDSISFDELLEWGLWSSYIRIYSECTAMKTMASLPEEYAMYYTFAQSKLEEIWLQMLDSKIPVFELQKVFRHQQHMENLCCAVGVGIDVKDTRRKQQWSAETVHKIIQQRVKEVSAILDYRGKLKYLCTLVPNATDFAELTKELSNDISRSSIGLLCACNKEGIVVFHCLKSASPLHYMLDTFSHLSQNDLFIQLWGEKMAECCTISIPIVAQQVWPKAYSHAQQLMEALYGRTLKLADVDRYLSKYKTHVELGQVLENLNTQLGICTGISNDGKWIANVVETIVQYWSLKEHEKAAKTFLRVKEKLKLTGNFKQVEALAAQVSLSMKDQALQVVDKSLVGVGQFLQSFMTGQHREKLCCLETFITCQDVVEWLREVTKDVVDLQSFVNVSLTTSAGEGDLANDKLSTLSIVGTGYRSLIYELKLDASFETLSKSCTTIWKALEANPKLPKLLEDCNRELEWYKSVKATQGRVEVTSFELMRNILQYGHFTIESDQGCIDIHDAVRVDLDDKKLAKKNFTLDELRDLESKLVLITGSKTEQRKQVDLFLDTLHSICHIADILLSLQQAGNVQYLRWRMDIPCTDSKSLVDKLQGVARKMEDDLKKWNEEVKGSRTTFYELNNYTTAQLVKLRKELGKMKANGGVAVVEPGVMLLLQSISPDLTPAAVKDSVLNFLMEAASPENQRTEAMLCSQHGEFSKQPILSGNENLNAHHQPPSAIGPLNVNRFETNVILDAIKSDAIKPTSSRLTIEQLTGKVKDAFINLTSTYGFPPRLVLSALEQCGEDKYAAEDWCNEHLMAFTESEAQLDDEATYPESREEQMDQTEQQSESQSKINDEFHLQEMEVVQPKEVSVITMRPIDASHASVIELMGNGYSEEVSIRAAQRFGGNTLEALNFLLSTSDGELFHGETMEITECHQVETTRTSEVIIYNASDEKHTTTEFLTLSELGSLLRELSSGAQVQQQRPFSKQLKAGSPNLLITNPDNVLKTVLSLYMEDKAMPLPSLEEVLICTQQTTEEEVTLLWRRAVGDPDFKRIFCLVHAEKLSYQVCDRSLWTLDEITQGKSGYRLVIVCTNEGEERSHFISKLHAHQQQYTPIHTIADFCMYLKSKFTTTSPAQKQFKGKLACNVDHESSCVRVVKSKRSGMGKSLYIWKMAKKLEQLKGSTRSCVTIPIHGPIVTPDTVLKFLQEYIDQSFSSTIFHFDISPKILRQVDTLLFSLLVLRGIYDSHGSVWRCHLSQLCAVEITVPLHQTSDCPERCALALLELLPTVECVSPYEAQQLMKSGQKSLEKRLMDEEEFRSSTFQLVYQYLRRHIAKYDLDEFSFTGAVEGSAADCLYLLLTACGVQNPSWLEIRNFVMFLNIQLHSCQNSELCNVNSASEGMKGLKGFVVKFMIRMSRDFATPSLQGEEDIAARGISENDLLKDYQISKRKQWEQSPSPYIFFNEDRMSITFLGFKVDKITGNLINPADGNIIERAIINVHLLSKLELKGVNFSEDYRAWNQNKELMVQKLGTVLGLKNPKDPDVSYVLTVDNLIKILAIQMRFRCDIPVVIMGETGCGKTRLIRYMCDLIAQSSSAQNTMFILKVHGGTTEDDIIKAIDRAQAQAEQNRLHNLDTVLFFDEANTTDAIGLIKEIMCDHRVNGKPISKDLKFIAACNPYRKHTDKMIKKLESAGLGFYVKSTETQDRLGKIPLRQLVYRVLELPPSMRPLVYDFGQLNKKNENEYVAQIVKNHFTKIAALSKHIASVANVLAWSQEYMRKREDECSFVSLRDVERCMIVFEYFFEQMGLFSERMNDKATKENKEPLTDPVSRSLVLALSICYHARLQDRTDYENGVSKQFISPLALPGGVVQFKDEIKWCQEVLLDGMLLGPNIARNSALRENVFMMVICIELRIPLFLVGKPGSSKSLAKSIVSSSMQGKASQHPLLRHFKQVHMFSYQCSQLSTPESVIEVFKTASHFQQNRNVAEFVSVVVLDEVGLAEDSPNLPLKALHPLLEDGTEGADDTQQIIAREKRVAFIGISNWALDPAKMNRGVMLTRGEPSSDELTMSARGICSNQDNDRVRERLEGLFAPLSEAYYEICKQQKRDFFGLRDFYSLVKMLYWICAKSNAHPLNWQSLEHAVRRNFGGLEQFDPVEVFRKRISLPADPQHSSIPDQLRDIVSPGCSQLDLIKASLKTRETTWHGENRYLLFLTENYAALRILHHYLHDAVQISSTKSRDQTDEQTDTLNLAHMEPFVLFGSSFPRDKEYTQVCRNINQIKICMETGRTVILLNLESLYESLYDVLNQYYIYHGGNRYVDLGLQTHRVKCRVHDNFKLILIAEKAAVYEKFPTPLINRLEKHFVLTKSILTNWQNDVLEIFDDWIDQFCNIEDLNRSQKFSRADAFVGYQNDTPAAVVFQATYCMSELQQQLREKPATNHFVLDLAHLSVEAFVAEKEGSEVWSEAVLMQSKWLLLQTASPAALIRLKSSSSLRSEVLVLNDIYFHHQCHSSLREFLSNKLIDSAPTEGLLIQVTTSSHLLTNNEVDDIANELRMPKSHVSCYLVQEFNTELDFCNKISSSFKRDTKAVYNTLLIIQCEAGHLYGDLIACARYRVYDERAKAVRSKFFQQGMTHVVFIIQLPPHTTGSSFVGFQGEPWTSVHIDELHSKESEQFTLSDAMNYKISELFVGASHFQRTVSVDDSSEDRQSLPSEEMECSPPLPHIVPQHQRLYFCIQAAAAKLRDVSNNKDRAVQRIAILHDLIPKCPQSTLGDTSFYGALVGHIYRVLLRRDEVVGFDKDWVLNEALDCRRLQQSGTFRNSLTRRLDEVITPIFAAVIAFCDQYSNLNLAKESRDNNSISKFWLSMFSNSDVIQFNYEDMATNPKSDLGGGSVSEDFKCQMPFFWIIKEAVDSMLSSVSNYGGKNAIEMMKQVCSLVSQTSLGEVLGSAPDDDVLYHCYLHDYVKSVHRTYHTNAEVSMQENNLVTDALNQLTCGTRFCSIDDHRSLTVRICTLHVVYEIHKAELLWFGQLTQQIPSIVLSMQPSDSPDKMVLHLHAVEKAYEHLEPPIMKEHAILKTWMRDVQKSQNAVDSILLLPSTPLSFSRSQWYMILAIKLFVEDIILKHEGTAVYAKRLHSVLRTHVDFHEADTVDMMKKVLNSMNSECRKALKDESSQLKALRNDCHVFFMEVVSTLCFGYGTPEDRLIKMLIDTVFSEKGGAEVTTKELTYSETTTDSVPVIRSFLLKLLVDQRSEQVKVHLQNYFEKSRRAVSGIDQGLCLLCVQCFEDSTYKELSVKSLNEIADEDVVDILEKAYTVLCNQHTRRFADVTVSYLEKVAHMRYGLSVVAEVLRRQVTVDEQPIVAHRLIQIANKICTDSTLNDFDPSVCTGPSVFLVKLIVRHYGIACLEKIVANHPWVVPEILQNEGQDQKRDPFVMYGPDYVKVRDAVSGAIYGNLVKELSDVVKAQAGYKVSYLPLSIFEVATLSKASTQPSKRIPTNAATDFAEFIKSQPQLGNELMRIAQTLLMNKQSGPLAQLQVTPQQPSLARDLTTIAIHTAIVLSARKDADVLAPFVNMLNNPSALVNAYLPTMPEDNLPDVRRAISGQFYQCPRGHPYLVTECGRPMVTYTCHCGAQIGGHNHVLVTTNTAARTTDETQSGHVLGSPEGRSNTLPERGLSPAGVCILRALMHTALLWASCHNQSASAGLVQLIKPALNVQDIPAFLLRHLEKDVTLLGKALGRSVDEAVLVIHLVLHDILVKDVPRLDAARGPRALAQRPDRDNWEALFNQTYVQPLLKDWDQRVGATMQAMLNDQSKDQDRLFFTVYERAKIDDKSTEPHFWIYRPRISLEHLTHNLSSNENHKRYTLLNSFLQEEPNLRATQYLPDIAQLQQYLYNKCNGQFDRKDGKMTIDQLIKKEKVEGTRVHLQKLVSSLSKAWELVHERLPEHARLRVEHKYLIPSISLDTKLEYLIPTTTGAGVCTSSLVDFLVCTHNSFIGKCRDQDKKWTLQKIPITQLNSCHVVDYERQLIPIVLSHCHYSLTYGKGQQIEYDFPALEKHILDRFIYGKPHIMLEIPHVVFKEDRYTEAIFGAIRKKVHQEILPRELQEQIINELRSMHRLKEAMDAIEIILVFVSSGGAKADKNLGEYAERALRMDKQFCSVAQKYCRLKHVVSLWQTVSIQFSRQLVLKEQEPFEQLDKGFSEALTESNESALNKVLRSYDIDPLLGLLFEFIETHLRHSQSELEWPLIDTLQAFVDTHGISLGSKYFEELGEVELLNSQAVAVWKHIVVYQDKQRRGT